MVQPWLDINTKVLECCLIKVNTNIHMIVFVMWLVEKIHIVKMGLHCNYQSIIKGVSLNSIIDFVCTHWEHFVNTSAVELDMWCHVALLSHNDVYIMLSILGICWQIFTVSDQFPYICIHEIFLCDIGTSVSVLYLYFISKIPCNIPTVKFLT